MVKNILIFFFAVGALGANAQSQSWLWAKSAGGSENDASNGVKTDINGNSSEIQKEIFFISQSNKVHAYWSKKYKNKK